MLGSVLMVLSKLHMFSVSFHILIEDTGIKRSICSKTDKPSNAGVSV